MIDRLVERRRRKDDAEGIDVLGPGIVNMSGQDMDGDDDHVDPHRSPRSP